MKNFNPKVSIGMPVFNGEPYIREAISSLIAQKFTDFELIISDNGSTDSTEQTCRAFAMVDARIRYVRQEENKGGLFNFLYVLENATGDYFMWAAADDWWSQDWLSAIVPLLDDQSVEIAFGETMRTKVDLSPDGPVKFYSIKNESTAIRLLRFFMLDENTKGNLFYGLMRTPMIKSIKIYVPKKTKYGWDYLQIFRILVTGKIGYAPHVILKKRNTVIGVRRFKYNIPQLAIQYALSFKESVSADKLNYYFEFYKLAPNSLSKFIILFLIPIKIIISIGYGYARGARSGLEILQTRPKVDN